MAAPNHSPGLSFKKLDLHLHTPASRCFRDRSVTPAQIVDAALAAGLDGIAVTDHNSGAWIDDVRQAAAGKPLAVFAGVEITCQGGKSGLHVIALLDTSAGKAEIESLLSALDFEPKDYGKQDAVVMKSIGDVLRVIDQRGGLAVLAHANSSRGVLCDMDGQQRTEVIKNHLVRAAEGTDFQNADKQARRKRVVDLLDGSDPTFLRKLAVYQASDNPLPDESGDHGLEGIGTRCAYFKLDRINLEGLRQCLHDPDVRIRQDFEFKTVGCPRITEVRVTSGFLEAVEAPFHDGLNSILGAKGAGKSLLVEFMRFALDQPPENDEIRADHDSKLQERLREFGTVEVDVCDESGKMFKVKRTLRSADDSPFDDPAFNDIARLFPVMFLSQNEIIRIAENTADQLAFIDRFFDFRAYQVTITQLEHDLASLDKQYADCLHGLEENAVLAKSVNSSQLELNQLNTALKNPVFEDYQKLELKDRAFREQSTYVRQLTDTMKAEHDVIERGASPALPEPLAADPALQRARAAAIASKQAALAKIEDALKDLQAAHTAIAREYQTWRPDFDKGKQTYEQTVQKEGGDYKNLAAKRAKVMKELEALQARQLAVKARIDRMRAVTDARNAKLQELKGVYDGYSGERRAKCAKFEQESNGKLKLTLHEASDRDAFRSSLQGLKRGSYLRDAEVQAISKNLDPTTFIRALVVFAVKKDPATLQDVAAAAGLEVERMKTLAEFLLGNMDYEQLLQLQYKAMPADRPEILYRVAADRFEPLGRLSVGQKCTAMLIMALSDGSMPVVIDQPEDSLDIRSVWDDMCKTLRTGKEKRQFIFTTHNASLAVASDSDKFIVMEGDADRGRIVFSGSMDHGPVSDEVLKYLEGGPATYQMKYLKYDASRRLTN